MAISRRSFLHAGAVAAVAASLPLGVFARGQGQALQEQNPAHIPFPVPGASRLDPMFYLNKASFTPYVDTTFRLRGEGKQAALLTLVAVEDLRASARRPDRDGCSLLFTSARQKPLPQSTYQFEHDSLGEFSLLLVRLNTRHKGAARYEAIINRLYP